MRVQVSLAALLPESPRWLVRQGQLREAQSMLWALRAPRGDDPVVAEMEAMVAGVKRELELRSVNWREVGSLRGGSGAWV
ncbi:unnamed protein product [Discosporangium mesarthrocarpum]